MPRDKFKYWENRIKLNAQLPFFFRHPERAAFRAREEPRHGANNRLYKKGQKRFFLAWDYYGRGTPLPHNDVVKQKRFAKSKF